MAHRPARKGHEFRDHWDYSDKVMEMLGAVSVDIRPTELTFKTGRPKFEAIYSVPLDDDEELVALDAMQMISKQGKPYYWVLKPSAKDIPRVRACAQSDEETDAGESDFERLYFGID